MSIFRNNLKTIQKRVIQSVLKMWQNKCSKKCSENCIKICGVWEEHSSYK